MKKFHYDEQLEACAISCPSPIALVKCVMYSPKWTVYSVPWITCPPHPQHTFPSFQVNHACFQKWCVFKAEGCMD